MVEADRPLGKDAFIRVAAYVDGFNLYHGLKEKHGRRYLWLDLQALVASLLKPGQRLEKVRYFTARVRNEPAALACQATYLHALGAHTNVEIVLGRFQQKRQVCRRCGATWRTYEEKETDVSIAVSLLRTASTGGSILPSCYPPTAISVRPYER
jgi:hypothetical protein